MSTKRSRQLGNEYIREEDIQNYIYDSDEEDQSKGLIGDKDEITESKNKRVLKDKVVRDGRKEAENGSLRVVLDVHEIDCYFERERQKLKVWYGSRRFPSENKLSDSTSKQQDYQEKKSVLQHLTSGSNNNSELIVDQVDKKTSEDTSKETVEESSKTENSLIQNIKRKTSRSNSLEVGFPKRFKVEDDKEMTDTPALKPLKIELALENNRRNEPIKRRNINTIIEELDQIGRNWRECHSKRLPSFRWGQTIIKNCSEKWDSHYFSPKILEINQKRSQERYLPSSRIISSSKETDYNGCDPQSDIVEARGVRIESERVDEEASDTLDYEQGTNFSGGSNSIGDDLNSFSSDIHESATMRNEGILNEASSSEQSTKDKSSKKSSQRGSKEQKKQINSNRLLTSQMERNHGSHRQFQNEDSLDSNKNFEDIRGNYENYGSSSQMNAGKSNYEDNSAQGITIMNEDDHMTCPICEKKFKKNKIETHASQCATEFYKD